MSGSSDPLAAAPIGEAEFASAFSSLAGARHILIAVSGGPDSVTLMHALARWAGGPRLSVATVDHRLRPESAAEAAEVGQVAAWLRLPHAILPWMDRPSGRVSQELARQARYRLLAAQAELLGASHLATAHTLDDQAETIMMRLAAGSGITGLAGIRAAAQRRGLTLVRPFLGFAKARLLATCKAEGWASVDDPSNRQRRFARVRWRALLPSLAAEGLDAARLARLAERLARADAALDTAACEAFVRLRRPDADGTIALDGAGLAAEPAEIALRVLALAIDEPEVRLARLEACLDAIVAAVASGRPLRRTLAGQLLSLDRDGRLTVTPEPLRHRGRAVR